MATVREEPSYSPQSLVCLYCNDIFSDPKILTCLHSFCRKCLDSYDVIGAGTHSVVCPLCRTTTPIPEAGVKGLPSNFLLNNSLDNHSVKTSKEYTLHCTNCEDEATANSRCLECAEFLCSKCVMAHRRIRMTKDHRIIPLDTLQADKQTLHRPSFCPQHGDEIYMFYCSPCERLICRECTILDHRGHKYTGKYKSVSCHTNRLLLHPMVLCLESRSGCSCDVDCSYTSSSLVTSLTSWSDV